MSDIIERLNKPILSGEFDRDEVSRLKCDAVAEIERLRASQERLKSAIEFAHSEGFQWPSDPMQEFAVTAA
jgi:hypothetical protein